jgi:hypothetical protein
MIEVGQGERTLLRAYAANLADFPLAYSRHASRRLYHDSQVAIDHCYHTRAGIYHDMRPTVYAYPDNQSTSWVCSTEDGIIDVVPTAPHTLSARLALEMHSLITVAKAYTSRI